jgi:putative transposase
MKKDYQTSAARAAMSEIVMPDVVSVAMSELTGAVREGLLALAVGAGLQVMQVLMDESVTALAGPKGTHGGGEACSDIERFRPLRVWVGSAGSDAGW